MREKELSNILIATASMNVYEFFLLYQCQLHSDSGHIEVLTAPQMG